MSIHRSNRIVICSFGLLTCACAMGQAGMGEVRLYVHPTRTMEFILDGNEHQKGVTALRLPEGTHAFTFWAPGCHLWDTVVSVAPADTFVLRKQMRPTEAYLAYALEEKRSLRDRGLWKLLPAAGTVASGIWALAARKKHNDAYDEYTALRDSYGTLNAPEAITNVKEDALPRAAEEVDRTRGQLMIALSVGAASALATVYGFLRKGRPVAPFHDQEKVKFDGLVWLPDTDGGSIHMGLTWTIR